MEQLCPKCGKAMKFVPAGISKKSGKPYDAFYACKDYGCNTTIKVGANDAPRGNFSPTEAPKTEQVKGMMIMNAMNNATAIVSELYPELGIDGGSVSKEELIEGKINHWFLKIYNKLDSPFVK